ncbi:MAG: hypothetical protein K6G07_00215, partial [Lachnospiraceae bacterium]|nr:hypothetical protein [Lachnospiraceae bacterium]
ALAEPALTSTVGLAHMPAMSAYFRADSSYVYVSKDTILPRLGDCFIESGQYAKSVNNIDKLSIEGERAADAQIFALGNRYAYTFLSDIKGAATIESTVAFGYDAAVNTSDTLKRFPNYADIADNSLSNYYLYHWIVTSGRYVWKPKSELFVSVELEQEKEDVTLSKDLVRIKNGQGMAQRFDNLTMQNIADSWGTSYDSMRSIFSEPELSSYRMTPIGHSVELEFDEAFDGDEADFMYVELSGMQDTTSYYMAHHFSNDADFVKKENPLTEAMMRRRYNIGHVLAVTFKDDFGKEHTVFAHMGDGKYLICLGSCGGWLLNEHTTLVFEHYVNDIQKPMPEEVNVQFLKLREIEP